MAENFKLFKVWESDGNDRDVYAHVKALTIDNVIDWLKKTYFKSEALNEIDISIESESDAIITWTEQNCEDCENKESEKCEFCEIPTSYLEILEIEQPEKEDYSYKTIYGTDEFYDLTTVQYLTTGQATKNPNWNNSLVDTWKADSQKGVNELVQLTNIAMANKKELTTLKGTPSEELIKLQIEKDRKAKEGQ